MQVTTKTIKQNLLIKTFIQLIIYIFSPLWIIVGIVVAWRLSRPKKSKLTKETPHDFGMVFESITFKSNRDQTSLRGWWIPTQSETKNTTVIFAHGYRGNRTKKPFHILKLAKRLSDEGHDLILFDFRNSGESDGRMSTVGYLETEDFIGAVDFAKKEKGANRFVFMGWSMGAVVTLMAGAKVKEEVTAIIADSSFADMETYLQENLPIWTKLPTFITPFVIGILPWITRGLHPRLLKPLEALNHIQCPILFLHSKEDKAIPFQETTKLYQNYNGIKDIFLFSKGGHIQSHIGNVNYEDKITAFINKHT